MKTKNNLRGLGRISAALPLVLVVLVMIAVSACGDPDPGGNPGNDPQLLTALKNTKWVHRDGDRVEFGTNTVTVVPISGISKTYTLKDSITVSELNQTILYFGNDYISDFIIYRNGTINSVGLGGIEKTGNWQRDTSSQSTWYTITFNPDGGTVTPTSKQVISGNRAEDLPRPTKANDFFGGWYTAQNGGGTVFTSATIVTGNITVYAKWAVPEELTKHLQLTEANWKAILTEIKTAGKYVNLDLSACTRSDASTGGGLRSNGTFDPIRDFEDGKEYITSLILPNTATSIVDGPNYYNSTFKGFSNIDSVSAPAVTNIGDYAFYRCTSLTSADFPQVTSIGNFAFIGCTSLSSVIFPVATTIDGAFQGCTSLSSVSFPVATTIDGAFQGCTSLTSVSFPQATSIGPYTFEGCTSLTSVSFPAATKIGHYAFYRCTSLTSINFPAAATIGSGAFYGCTSLTSVSFPQVTSIGSIAFQGCTSLTSVSFPMAGNIYQKAFESTGNIALTITLGQRAPQVNYNMFENVDSAKTVTVKVPTGATGYGTIPATYSGDDTTANWGNGFRGGGWTGSWFDIVNNQSCVRYINSNITLYVQYQ